MYFSTLTTVAHTATFEMMGMYGDQIAQGLQLASWDMGGDILGFFIQQLFGLFG
jgi:hypothetical protein